MQFSLPILKNHCFTGEEFRFGTNPLLQIHERLKAGDFSPDIAKMRHMIKKAEDLEAKQRHKRFKVRLKRDVLESRRKLLTVVRTLPPGVEPKVRTLINLKSKYSFPVLRF